MSSIPTPINQEIYQYILQNSLRETPIQQELRTCTHDLPGAIMQISPDQGQFFQLLIKLLGAKRTIDIGVYTGYSALAVALALPEDGSILACDVSSEFTGYAESFWERSGIRKKIDLHIAPAAETLEAAIQAGQSGSFDFAFIDADKVNTRNYYEQCLTLIRKGGVIAIDNTLQDGNIIHATHSSTGVLAMRDFNHFIHRDPRVDISFLTVADGITLAYKKD